MRVTRPWLSATLVALAVGAAVFCAAFALSAKTRPSGDAEIKTLEQNFLAAFQAKDAAKVMSFYAPGEQLFVFDVIPPRQYAGHEAYKKDWEDFFSQLPGPLTVDMSDLSVTTNGSDLAYSHSIQHVAGTFADGKPLDLTVRVTDVYRKMGGKWMIVHEHVSVPVDLKTGAADLQSKP